MAPPATLPRPEQAVDSRCEPSGNVGRVGGLGVRKRAEFVSVESVVSWSDAGVTVR